MRSHGVANKNKSPFEGALPIGLMGTATRRSPRVFVRQERSSTRARTRVRPRVFTPADDECAGMPRRDPGKSLRLI